MVVKVNISKIMEINETDFRVVFGGSRIEFDPDKEEFNRNKHGYSLESAVDLIGRWVLPISSTPFITSDPVEINGEIRHRHIGVDDSGNVVFIVTTMRPGEVIRVISFRKANHEERELFATHTGYVNANSSDEKNRVSD